MTPRITRIAALALSLCLGASVLPAQAADSARIGFLTTLSGPGSALGLDARDGFKLALEHLGDKLGGLPVKLSVADDQQDPQAGRQGVDRLLKRDKVDVMTGIVFSNVLLPVLPEILRSDTVYLSANTGPRDYAGAKCDPNFFAVAWQNEDIPAAMGRFATDKGYKRIALIAPNYPGGRESLDGFKRLYKGEIVQESYAKLGQLDFAPELAAIRSARPDAVFFFLPGGMGINFIKQFGASGLGKDAALLTPGFSADEDTIKAVGNALVGTFNASQWAADMDNPANKRFVADFAKRYGRAPTMYAAQSYDAALLLDAAVRKAGGKIEDRAALRAALRTAQFGSLRGAFRFNTNQYPIQDIYMREVYTDSAGRITNRTVGKVLSNHADAFVGECKMAAR
ncbi:MAG: ABC transporter substrate-binding protein [Comamonas sp.]